MRNRGADTRHMHPIELARKHIGLSQAAFALRLGVSQSTVSSWVCGRINEVPPDRCPEVEALTSGHVRCEQLRPDLQWQRDAAGQVTGYVVPLAKAG